MTKLQYGIPLYNRVGCEIQSIGELYGNVPATKIIASHLNLQNVIIDDLVPSGYLPKNFYIFGIINKYKRDMIFDKPSNIKELTKKFIDSISNSECVRVKNHQKIIDYITNSIESERLDLAKKVYGLFLKTFKDDAILYINLNEEEDDDNKFLEFIIRQNKYSDKTMDLIDNMIEECETDMINKKTWIYIGTDFENPV